MEKINNMLKTLLLSFLILNSTLVHSCGSTSARDHTTTCYYSKFNEFCLDGVICTESENAIKVVTNADTISVYYSKTDSVKYVKRGGSYYRKEAFNLENWGKEPCKHAWKYPRIYHCYTQNDTIIELMQEYCKKDVSYSEIYLKTKGASSISVVRMKEPIQGHSFKKLLEIFAQHQGDEKLTSSQITDTGKKEGTFCVTYSTTSEGLAFYTNSVSPFDTLMVRQLKYPHYFGLNCGVFEDAYLPTITEVQLNPEIKDISVYVQSKLNTKAISSINVPDGKRRAIVEIFISEKGAVDEVKIARSVHPDFDEEIRRVCKALPLFSPKTVDGKNVKSRIVFPVFLPKMVGI